MAEKNNSGNNSKSKKERQCCFCRLVFAICLVVSAVLVITGFFMPPRGEISGSVLKAVGELLLFPTLAYGFRAIELGLEIKFQKGDTSISVSRDENEDSDEK